MNSAEKARLAREAKEEEERLKREESAKRRREGIENLKENIDRVIAITLDILVLLSTASLAVIGYMLLIGADKLAIYWWLLLPAGVLIGAQCLRSYLTGVPIYDTNLRLGGLVAIISAAFLYIIVMLCY